MVDVLSKVQACLELGFSERTLDRAVRSGRIPAFRHGRRIVFRQEDILEAAKAAKMPVRIEAGAGTGQKEAGQ